MPDLPRPYTRSCLAEREIVERMRQLRAEGLTCYAIAKRLDANGLKPRKAAKWAANVVSQILERVVNRSSSVSAPCRRLKAFSALVIGRSQSK
jgi:Recombinase